MNAVLRWFEWPLLAKELAERAARKRTYVIRVLYAVGFFLLVLLSSHSYFSVSTFAGSGNGGGLVRTLVMFQFLGLYIFLPAIMAGSISQEKERDSLVLLLLTDIKPWQLLLQKFFSGLVPMLSFLMLSLPLFAVAYALGGVPPERLLLGVGLLLLACFQVGAFALMCSAYFRTTVGSLLGTYLLGSLFYVGGSIVVSLVPLLYSHHPSWQPFDFCVLIFPPVTYGLAENGSLGPGLAAVLFQSSSTRAELLIDCGAILASAVAFILLARFFFLRRAFANSRSLWMACLRGLDRLMHRANRRAGSVVLFKDKPAHPGNEPIFWREVSKGSLGARRYLLRLLLPIEFVIILAASGFEWGGNEDAVAGMLCVAWGLAFLILTIRAANVVVAERIHQTLEVLLTTPMPAIQIVWQKYRVLRRLMFILAVPLLTLHAIQLWALTSSRSFLESGSEVILYTTSTVLTFSVYLPMFTWISLWIGLKARSRAKAVLLALALVVAWCLVPPIIIAATEAQSALFLVLLSPGAAIVLNESHHWRDIRQFAWLPMLANFSAYWFISRFFRRKALVNADLYLRGAAA